MILKDKDKEVLKAWANNEDIQWRMSGTKDHWVTLKGGDFVDYSNAFEFRVRKPRYRLEKDTFDRKFYHIYNNEKNEKVYTLVYKYEADSLVERLNNEYEREQDESLG